MSHQVTRWLWAIFVMHASIRVCGEACLSVDEGVAYNVGGDAIITELLPLHHGELCDKINMAEVQVLEATKMAVQRVNELDLVPGVSLGLRVVDTCGEVGRSVKLALASLASDARSCQPTLSLGFLGPGDAESASAVGRATRALHTPVVAYGPRPVLVPDTLDLITPAPQRSVKAAVQVLSVLDVISISIVHTADEEGRILAEHFKEAAYDNYQCVEMALEADDGEDVTEVLREGPGTVVILGTKEKSQSLARTLGAPGGPAELILMLDNAGPVPEAELEGVETPLIILQRTAPTVPEFLSFLERDILPDDDPMREYVATMSNCESCSSSELGYDASAPAAMAAVLVFAEALREAQAANCGTSGGLCDGIKMLKYPEWQEKLSQASLHAAASTAFPNLLDANLDPGSEDFPHYVVKFMASDNTSNITQVGHADESSATLEQVDSLELRCGVHCPCRTTTTTVYTTTTAMPELVPEIVPEIEPEILPAPDNMTVVPEIEPEILPAPDNMTAPVRPTYEKRYTALTGINQSSGGRWWNHKGWWPRGFQNQTHFTKMELATYFTAFSFVLVVLFSSSLVCIYNLQRPPSRR